MDWKKIKKFFTFSITSYVLMFFAILILIIFLIIFITVLKKTWYDALSVIAIIYIGTSLLSIIFSVGEFKHFQKIKNFFVIKKENENELTTFEKKQMKILNVKFKEKNNKKNFLLPTWIILLVVGIIFLIISLPFLFV